MFAVLPLNVAAQRAPKSDTSGPRSVPSVFSGVAGSALIDARVLVIAPADGSESPWTRTEVFETLRTQSGGYIPLNTITSGNGTYRVCVRFDYDQKWCSVSAQGVGFYDETPVGIDICNEGTDRSPFGFSRIQSNPRLSAYARVGKMYARPSSLKG